MFFIFEHRSHSRFRISGFDLKSDETKISKKSVDDAPTPKESYYLVFLMWAVVLAHLMEQSSESEVSGSNPVNIKF